MEKTIGTKVIEAINVAVDAIRTDPLIGEGTCSSIDECWGDEDIIATLLRDYDVEGGWTTVRQAVKMFRDMEQHYLERALDCREGNDSDPQLQQFREFVAARKAQRL